MLGKLLKHDFKSTGKVLLPLNLLLIVITVIGCIFLKSKIYENEAMVPLAIVLLLLYILALCAISLITVIYLIVHYYRNMFSAQGYLTFTLPASPWTIFHSKLITGISWNMITSLLTIISMFALVTSVVGIKDLSNFMSNFFSVELSLEGFVAGETLSVTMADLFGVSSWQIILFFIAFFIVSSFSSVAMGYGSVTIGQLYAKHKVIGSVLVYIGIFFFMQIVNGIVSFTAGFRTVLSTLHMEETADSTMAFLTSYFDMYRTLMIFALLFSLVIGLACYIVSLPILKKKVNLD